jgi:hypothetical protein
MLRALLAAVGVACGAAPCAAEQAPPPRADALGEVERDQTMEMVAYRLRHDLVCLCPRCARLRLDSCGCPEAVAERENIRALLRAKDLTTPDAREAAYEAIVQHYLALHGPAILAATPVAPDRWSRRLMPLLLLILLGVPCIFILRLQNKHAKRQKRGTRHGS